MNIGFDAKRAFWNQTGLGNYSRFILQGLAEFFPQHHYSLYSPSLHGPSPLFSPTPPLRPVNLGEGWKGNLARVARMAPHFRHDRLDVYHGLSNELPFFNKTHQTKLVVSIHDVLFLRYPHFYPLLDRSIYLAKTRHACRSSDLVLAISEQTKQDLIAFLHVPERKIKVHYQACHPQFSRRHSAEEIESGKRKYGLKKPYILQIGTLEERKNALFTLKAYAASKLKGEVQVALVGKKTPYCDMLYQFVQEANLTDHVHFIHQSDFPDFPLLYKGALFCVYPSLFEGFGIPILEALTVGSPMITSTGGCFHEVGGDAALYVDPSSVKQMSDAMERVFLEPSLRQEMIQKGASQAARFAPGRLISELFHHYEDL